MRVSVKHSFSLAIVFALLITTPALASSDSAWAALDKASAKACLHASGFLNAKVSAPTRFSDEIGYDARIVSGVYPQAHMKGAQGQMLCLFSRKTKTVEVQELAQWPAPDYTDLDPSGGRNPRASPHCFHTP